MSRVWGLPAANGSFEGSKIIFIEHYRLGFAKEEFWIERLAGLE